MCIIVVLKRLIKDPPSQMKFWLKSKRFPTRHNWLDELSFFCLCPFLGRGLQHEWAVYLVLSDVCCTFGCTLYFNFWKYKVHPKVHSDTGINMSSTGNHKRVQSTSESTFMYFWVYSVLLIVFCTFKCTLKGTRCTLNNVGKQDFAFSKNQKNTSIMHAHAFVFMRNSISTRVHIFPKVHTVLGFYYFDSIFS